MPTFKYTAKETTGKTVSGILEYSDKELLIDALRKKDLVIISIEETAKRRIVFFGGSVKLDEIVIFSRQLATMVDAGIPILQSLEALSEQTSHPTFKMALNAIREDIQVGSSLSSAFEKHPKIFDAELLAIKKLAEKHPKKRFGVMFPQIISVEEVKKAKQILILMKN